MALELVAAIVAAIAFAGPEWDRVTALTPEA